MRLITMILVILTTGFVARAQNIFTVILKDKDTGQPLIGASVQIKSLNKVIASKQNGEALFTDLPSGKFAVSFSSVGFQTQIDSLSFPFSGSQPYLIFLIADEEELEEVVISTTRSSRTIENIPTRVEAISGEELDEKGNMKPGDIRMLLNESTGIQTQQTSATSGNSSIRIQGLDGRYTQIIRDGFPLYAGFSSGLGLLQIAPLDLKQVEVIKGSASTLYGGGAIAGLVNLISKSPGQEPELSFLVNGTSALGLDVSGFHSQKMGKIGSTIFAAYNHGTAYDPASIGLTAIPEFDRFIFNPALFADLNDQTKLHFALNTTFERRLGGAINSRKNMLITNDEYFERNSTNRYSTQLTLSHKLSDRASVNIKNGLSHYNRNIGIRKFDFSGTQFASFSEASYHTRKENLEWVAGMNFLTDQFTEDKRSYSIPRDYKQSTLGIFVQNTWNTSDDFVVESGLRTDYHNDYGFFVLPRLSMLYINGPLSIRAGGGLGYKTPTVFTEDAERIQFRNVLPIDVSTAKAERSLGTNLDFNYRLPLFDNRVSFSINQLFYYTRINDPLTLRSVPNDLFKFEQIDGVLSTRGLETNLKFTYQDFKLFIGYTLADVKQERNGGFLQYPLVAKHRLNNVLMYELEDKWKIGLEGFYFSPQFLNDGTRGRSYWITGFMGERIFDNFSIFLNFENFLDTRQTRFDTIYTGDINNPIFRDIYAPVDGFVINGGLKIRL